MEIARTRPVPQHDCRWAVPKSGRIGAATPTLTRMRNHDGYPVRIGGTTKYVKKDLSFLHGDVQMEGGDLKLVEGPVVLDERIERLIEASADSVALDKVLQSGTKADSLKDYVEEITAVRSGDGAAEVVYKPAGHDSRTVRGSLKKKK